MDKDFKRIKKEYENFREEVLLLSKEEIYNKVFEINFYINIFEYMEFQEYEIPKGMALADLFDFYKKREHLHYNTYEDIELLLAEYRYDRGC